MSEPAQPGPSSVEPPTGWEYRSDISDGVTVTVDFEWAPPMT